jgi:hypothetical protein
VDGVTFVRFISASGEPVLMTFEECRSRYHKTRDQEAARILRNWPTPVAPVRQEAVAA